MSMLSLSLCVLLQLVLMFYPAIHEKNMHERSMPCQFAGQCDEDNDLVPVLLNSNCLGNTFVCTVYVADKVSSILFYRLILQSADGRLTVWSRARVLKKKNTDSYLFFLLPCAVAEHFHKG